MNPRSVLIAIALTGAASAAQALPHSDNMSFELFAGTNAAMPGSFRGRTDAFSSVNPAGSIVYDHLKIGDAYSNGLNIGGELDYAFSERLSTYGRASYSAFNGSDQRIGEFEAGVDSATTPITARFGDTSTRELALGARYMFAPGAKFRPFVGAALGATRLSPTRMAVSHLTDLGTTKVELDSPDDVFEQRVETGLQYSPMKNFDLRLTAAASHLDGERRSDDPNLALIGLDNARGDVRGHWDYPAELGAVWHF